MNHIKGQDMQGLLEAIVRRIYVETIWVRRGLVRGRGSFLRETGGLVVTESPSFST